MLHGLYETAQLQFFNVRMDIPHLVAYGLAGFAFIYVVASLAKATQPNVGPPVSSLMLVDTICLSTVGSHPCHRSLGAHFVFPGIVTILPPHSGSHTGGLQKGESHLLLFPWQNILNLYPVPKWRLQSTTNRSMDGLLLWATIP